MTKDDDGRNLDENIDQLAVQIERTIQSTEEFLDSVGPFESRRSRRTQARQYLGSSLK